MANLKLRLDAILSEEEQKAVAASLGIYHRWATVEEIEQVLGNALHRKLVELCEFYHHGHTRDRRSGLDRRAPVDRKTA